MPGAQSDPSRIPDLLGLELEKYLDYNMGLEALRTLLTTDFPILSTSGPWIEFTKIPSEGPTVDELAEGARAAGFPMEAGLVEAFRKPGILPGGRFYRHQAGGILSLLQGRNVILPHPTGSGKTETFVVPILNYLLDEIRNRGEYGLGCVMIFPTKALENDQRDRLKRILFELEEQLANRIPFVGVYDGDTPSISDFERTRNNPQRESLHQYREMCPRCKKDTLRYNLNNPLHLLRCVEEEDSQGKMVGCGYPEELTAGIPWIRTTREDMRSQAYPNILITNPESLDYRLLTPSDASVLKTRMPKVMVIIDEAHAYSAGAALSLRFLLSRMEEKIRAINGPDITFQYVIASATLDNPEEFAKKLIPWGEFVVVPFEAGSLSIGTERDARWSLGAPLGWLEIDSVDWILDLFGANLAAVPAILRAAGRAHLELAPMLRSLELLGILKVVDDTVLPMGPRVEEVWSLYTTEKESGRYQEMLLGLIRRSFCQMEQVQELIGFIEPYARKLDDVVDRWEAKWPEWRDRPTRDAILQIVYLGRRLGLWNERLHLFLRAPTGIAGCLATRPHPVRLSDEIRIPERCDRCNPAGAVYEFMTCQDCGEVYHGLLRCSLCNDFSATDTLRCGHQDRAERYAIRRSLLVGDNPVQSLSDGAIRIEDDKESCNNCSGPIRAIRRRTDLLIEMSVSLIGWYVPEDRRKFLLFTDGRAASERLSREFNNLETRIWAERLLAEIMTSDSAHDLHAPRSILEVRRKLFARLYRPYHQALRGVSTRYELEILDKTLGSSAFQALERGQKGSSRLFDNGLLAYSFDEFAPRIDRLGLHAVLPRICDVIRRKGNREKGISRSRLTREFVNVNSPVARALLEMAAGPANERIDESLTLLEDVRWILQVRTQDETWIRFNTGELGGEDPFESARDVRRICVPVEVSLCPNCGAVRWYPADRCEACGGFTERVTHQQLIERNYFAGILAREPRPLVAAVHRAGLRGNERKLVETRFRLDHNAIHFLSATPTLELGIDVGTLNFVFLSRVPPTRSNYIQRVGRAGRRRREGAVCVTFIFPTPLDGYYFRNPEPLVSMKAGRIPVQKLSTEHLQPLLCSALMDCFALVGPPGGVTALDDGRQTTREFLQGELDYKPGDFAVDLGMVWTSRGEDWIKRVLSRAAQAGDQPLQDSELLPFMNRFGEFLTDPSRVTSEFLRLDSFRAHESDVQKLHSVVSDRIAALRRSGRASSDNDELARLLRQDDALREYEASHMVSAPLLSYLHSVGSLSSARGIFGTNVPTYDLEAMDRAIDDREADLALMDRFPGAYLSRQGAIYQVKEVVYDPLLQPEIRQCSVCEAWLLEDVNQCETHPQAPVQTLRLRAPIVAFAQLSRTRTLETRGNVKKLIRARTVRAQYTTESIGRLPVLVGPVETIDIATVNASFDVLDEGHRVHQGLLIRICSNCNSMYVDNVHCCNNPSSTEIVQGGTFTTRGFRVELDNAALNPQLASLQTVYPEIANDPLRWVTQSLGNAILAAFSTRLEVESTMLDVLLDSNRSFWVLELVRGGYGFVDETRANGPRLQNLFEGVRQLIATIPGEHECDRYCDQCLIVPRRSRDELPWLHRRLLEALTGP